jgi:putative transposase
MTGHHKRVYRLDRQAHLQVRRRRRKRQTRGERVPLPTPSRCGERWSKDVTLDTLADGRAFSHAHHRRRLYARVPGD